MNKYGRRGGGVRVPVKYSIAAKFDRGGPYPTSWEIVERWSGGENRYPFATESEAILYIKQAEASAGREVREDAGLAWGFFLGILASVISALLIAWALGWTAGGAS